MPSYATSNLLENFLKDEEESLKNINVVLQNHAENEQVSNDEVLEKKKINKKENYTGRGS